jgi:hypothetical protein
MMHECPRCGFVQPKDRYCANCGLDIDNFKPVPKPLLRRMSENTGMQIALAIFIILGLGGWIYLTQKQAIDEKLSAALNLASPNRVAPEEALVEESIESDESESAAADMPAPVPSFPVAASSGTAASEIKKPSVGAKEFNVQFIEMSRLYLQQLAQENQVVDETAQTKSIIMASQPNASSFREKDPQSTVLPGGDTHSVRATRAITLDFMQMIGGPNDVAGMTIEITPSSVLEQSTEFTVNGTVTLRTVDGAVANYGFDGKFTLPNTSTLFVAGMVPRQAIRPEDQENFSGTPLVILSSPEFLNNTSELVLMIQPK